MPVANQITISVPKITICMPVYNVAPYLRRCLQSVLDQTFSDFLLIAVNDGSTDDSLAILQEFAEKDARIKVIDQENHGMSASRNVALAKAQSEYVCFLDSDDYLAPTYLQELYEAAEHSGADIACCYFYYHFVESGSIYPHPIRCKGVFSSEQALKKLLQDIQIQSYAWNKIYKRKLFVDYDITFPSMAFEDMATTYKLFYHANRVVVINRALHYYVQRPTSTLGSISEKQINDFIRATGMIRLSLLREQDFDQYRRSYRALCMKTGAFCLIYLFRIHMRRHSFQGFASSLRKCCSALRFYQSNRLLREKHLLDISDPLALPDVLSSTSPLGERPAQFPSAD